MSKHVPKTYEWFGKNLHDLDEKVGYMDHILGGCNLCRNRLEQNLKNVWETCNNTTPVEEMRLRGIEKSLVRFIFWKNENTYKDMKAVADEQLEALGKDTKRGVWR